MTPFPSSTPIAAPAITTREQLDALLENIARLHRERDEIRHTQEAEIAAVRQRHRAPLIELDQLLEVETSWAEQWACAHRDAFAADHTLTSEHATIGFHAEPPRIERASRRWTWTRIATTLAELPWGKRYLRIPAPEVDKDALAADLTDLLPDELRTAGMRVVQGERFYFTPHHECALSQAA